MIGSPASFISTQFTGQTLWHLAPQAMHFPSIREALPRGFFTGFTASVMENSFKNLFLTKRAQRIRNGRKGKANLVKPDYFCFCFPLRSRLEAPTFGCVFAVRRFAYKICL